MGPRALQEAASAQSTRMGTVVGLETLLSFSSSVLFGGLSLLRANGSKWVVVPHRWRGMAWRGTAGGWAGTARYPGTPAAEETMSLYPAHAIPVEERCCGQQELRVS